MHRLVLLVSVILLLFAATIPAHGMWAWMRDAAVAEFEDSDWDILKAEAKRVLDDVESGVRVDWRNEETGNSGAFKVLMTFTHEGMTCRQLAVLNLSRNGVRGVANYTLCRQPDGQWAFVSGSEIEP